MGKTFEGSLEGRGLRIGLISSRFNDFIAEHMVRGAKEALRQCGVADGNVDLVRVPGSLELPLIARRMAESGNYDALVCLGCVIRGSTPHFDLVCAETAKGISQVAHHTGVPAIFAVVTTDTIEQAVERAGTKMGNKGYEGALAAVEMATLLRAMGKPARAGRRGGRK